MSEYILREYLNLYHNGKFFMYGSANVNGFAVAKLFEISKWFFEREMYPGLVKDYMRRRGTC